ncbi:unnamed protein product, partial [Brenthis ino]
MNAQRLSKEQNQNKQSFSSYVSDPELHTKDTTGSREIESKPPNFVSYRCKRPRESNSPTSQFASFQEEMKEMILALAAEQKRDLAGIASSLTEISSSHLVLDISK